MGDWMEEALTGSQGKEMEWMLDDILADMLTLCNGVISQKKDDWEGMSQEQKNEWIREFAVKNSHPIRFEQ